LSKKATGIEVAAGYGSPSSGGGQNQASITAGFGDLNTDGYSVVLSGSYEKKKRYLDVTAAYASTSTVLPYFNGTATGLGNIQVAGHQVLVQIRASAQVVVVMVIHLQQQITAALLRWVCSLLPRKVHLIVATIVLLMLA
jgi:FlaG/FlaF family flagellin (archaellin)